MENLINLFLQYLPGILQAIAYSLVVWAWWSLKRIFVRHDDLRQFKTAVDARISELESTQQDRAAAQEQLKQTLGLLPTAKDFQTLALSMKEMEGDLKGMNSKMDGLSHATTRLERAVDMFTEASMEKPR